MTLIEFLRSARSNAERCQFVLYYAYCHKKDSLSSSDVRKHLVQARIPKSKTINVSDYLGKSGHLIDGVEVDGKREWRLTQSGREDVEKKLMTRIGSVPTLGKPARKIADKTIDILFLGIGPTNEDRLRLDEETRDIEIKIRGSEFRDNLNFRSKWAVRPGDLFQYMNELKPQIVHLSGHGDSDGNIAFEDGDGNSKTVSADALAGAFELMKDTLRIVVLNACHSEIAAAKIAKSIDCTVGLAAEIEDPSAIAFSAAFYGALGFGHSVQRAFREARSTLIMEGLPGDHLFRRLTKGGIDADTLKLLE